MSRDDRNDRPTREASLSSIESDEHAQGRAADGVRAIPSDRLQPAEFVASIYRHATRDAQLLSDAIAISKKWTIAAEIARFGLQDGETTQKAARQALEADVVDGRVFALLREEQRKSQQHHAVLESYELQTEKGDNVVDITMAKLGVALAQLRSGQEARQVLRTLIGIKDDAASLDPQIIELWRSITEDVLIAIGKGDKALELRAQRWQAMLDNEQATDEDRFALAVSLAALADHLQAGDDKSLSWYQHALGIEPNIEVAQRILRTTWKNRDLNGVERTLTELAENADDADVRNSAYYQVGMLRAHTKNDVNAGLKSLAESTVAGKAAGLGAAAYLSLARSSHGNAVPDEVVDALTARLDFAASGMERADLLTQMAERFDAEMQLPDVAVDMANEALRECAHWTPAVRLLGNIYARDARWEDLVSLHQRQLERERDPDVCRLLHERIADVAYHQLRNIQLAEKHLESALHFGWRVHTSRLLAQVYRDTERWETLYDYQMQIASRATTAEEQVRVLQDAANIAEQRLQDVTRAIESWSDVLQIEPNSTAATGALERIFMEHHRWEDLLKLFEHELAHLRNGNKPAQLSILCRCADIARTRLADQHTAESYYRRATELDPLYEDALRGFGIMLKEQGRWQDLIAMTEQEHDRSVSPERRAKCLRQIGEINVHELNDLDAAITTYKRLGALGAQWHEEALLWLERLYEAASDHKHLLSVLRGRRELEGDEEGRSRLSFRIAEISEWQLGKYGAALEDYVLSLDAPAIATEAILSIDRCLSVGRVPDEIKREALTKISAKLPALPAVAARCALDVLLYDAEERRDADAQQKLRQYLFEQWPEERWVDERLAIGALIDGDWSQAELAREPSSDGGTDGLRELWRRLETFVQLNDSDVDFLPEGHARAWLARELGLIGAYPGASDRRTLALIRHNAVSIGELIEPGHSWLSQQLAIHAARALRDDERLKTLLERAAEDATEPLLAMRLWLNASGESVVAPETRQGWLRHAARTGNFNHPMREDVYRALQMTGDMDGLVDALQSHINSGLVQGEELAMLAFRQARALDGIGRSPEAINALRVATVHAPGSAQIALEKSRIEALTQNVEAARSTIESVLASGCPENGRQEVYLRLAELHSIDGGNKLRAIEALEEAYVRAGRTRELGIRLAEMQLQFGDAARGAALLESILHTPMAEDELHLWSLLGRTYAQRLNQIAKAETLLWRIFDNFPTRGNALPQLEEIAIRSERTAAFAEKLRERLSQEDTLQISIERRADLWMHLGEFQLNVLDRPEEAEHSFASAAELPIVRSRALRMQAKAISLQEDRGSAAADMYVQAVSAPDFRIQNLPDIVVELDRLYATGGQPSRLRTVRQLRKVFGQRTPDVGQAERRAIGEPIDADALVSTLGEGMLNPRERFVLVEAGALAQRVFSKKAFGASSIETRRYKSDHFTVFDTALQDTCAILNTDVPKLAVSVNGIAATTTDGASFLVPAPRIGDETPDSARFWAGWVAAIAQSGLGAYTMVDDDDIRQLLSSVAKSAGEDVVPQWATMVDEIGKIRWMGVRRTAEAAHRNAPEVALTPGEGRAQAIRAIGDRFGAAYADNPGVALYEVLRACGEPVHGGQIGPQELRDHPRVLDLSRFLLSDGFLRLRNSLGIGSSTSAYGL